MGSIAGIAETVTGETAVDGAAVNGAAVNGAAANGAAANGGAANGAGAATSRPWGDGVDALERSARDGRHSSRRVQPQRLEDPRMALVFIDELVTVVQSDAPLGAHACYLATNLLRHLEARRAALVLPSRLAAATAAVDAKLREASAVAERLEHTLGELLEVSGAYRQLAGRELTRMLQLLREHLRLAAQEELDLAFRAHWDDLGESG